jgi:hypothetical protein
MTFIGNIFHNTQPNKMFFEVDSFDCALQIKAVRKESDQVVDKLFCHFLDQKDWHQVSAKRLAKTMHVNTSYIDKYKLIDIFYLLKEKGISFRVPIKVSQGQKIYQKPLTSKKHHSYDWKSWIWKESNKIQFSPLSLEAKDTVGDGNCLIHAIFGAEDDYGEIFCKDAEKLRKVMANEFFERASYFQKKEGKSHHDFFYPTVLESFEQEDLGRQRNIIDLIRTLERTNPKLGLIDLGLEHAQMIAFLKELNILVRNQITNQTVPLFYNSNSEEPDRIIGHNGHNHWVKMIKIQEKIPEEIDLKKSERLEITQAIGLKEYPEGCFGPKEWETYFGEVGKVPPLPNDIDDILNGRCPYWPDKLVKDTHNLVLIPKSINSNNLTLNVLSQLIKNPIQGEGITEGYTDYRIPEKYQNKTVGDSYWILITKDRILNSIGKKFSQGSLKDNDLPKAIEACISFCISFILQQESPYKGFIRIKETAKPGNNQDDDSHHLAHGGFRTQHVKNNSALSVWPLYYGNEDKNGETGIVCVKRL